MVYSLLAEVAGAKAPGGRVRTRRRGGVLSPPPGPHLRAGKGWDDDGWALGLFPSTGTYV